MRGIKSVFLWTCWFMGLFHLARYLTQGKLRILCYHGFDDSGNSSFRPKLLMAGETFRMRLALLNRFRFNVLSLDAALNGLRQRDLAPNSVVLTFDDAHYSTYSIGLPALESYGYPATVYVTTYYVRQQTPVFNLMVDYLLWKASLSNVMARNVPWALNRNVNLSDPDARDRLARSINEAIDRCESNKGRETICQELASLLGLDYTSLKENRFLTLMSLDELRDLGRRGMDIQLHTHRHRLPVDNRETVIQEITENRRMLKEVTDAPLRHFCYPSGLWSREHWTILADQNIESATTCELGLNDGETPVLALRRIVDGEDVSRIEFLSELFGFGYLMRRLHNLVKHRDISVRITPTDTDVRVLDQQSVVGHTTELDVKKNKTKQVSLWIISILGATFENFMNSEMHACFILLLLCIH